LIVLMLGISSFYLGVSSALSMGWAVEKALAPFPVT
jgi:hypothetical protein